MISTYIAYANEDEDLKERLECAINLLVRRNIITLSSHRSVTPGKNWETHIAQAIESAKLILVLCSPDFFNNEWCYEYEIKRAIQQHKSQQSVVIPIVARPCNLDSLDDLIKNQWLPRNGTPVTRWQDQDEAWLDVCRGVNRAVQTILGQTT